MSKWYEHSLEILPARQAKINFADFKASSPETKLNCAAEIYANCSESSRCWSPRLLAASKCDDEGLRVSGMTTEVFGILCSAVHSAPWCSGKVANCTIAIILGLLLSIHAILLVLQLHSFHHVLLTFFVQRL